MDLQTNNRSMSSTAASSLSSSSSSSSSSAFTSSKKKSLVSVGIVGMVVLSAIIAIANGTQGGNVFGGIHHFITNDMVGAASNINSAATSTSLLRVFFPVW